MSQRTAGRRSPTSEPADSLCRQITDKRGSPRHTRKPTVSAPPPPSLPSAASRLWDDLALLPNDATCSCELRVHTHGGSLSSSRVGSLLLLLDAYFRLCCTLTCRSWQLAVSNTPLSHKGLTQDTEPGIDPRLTHSQHTMVPGPGPGPCRSHQTWDFNRPASLLRLGLTCELARRKATASLALNFR